MTLDEFFKEIEDDFGDFIVKLKYKGDHEKTYRTSNEILSYDDTYGFCWLNDWNEGETDVEVVGYINVDDVKVEDGYK